MNIIKRRDRFIFGLFFCYIDNNLIATFAFIQDIHLKELNYIIFQQNSINLLQEYAFYIIIILKQHFYCTNTTNM